MKNKKNKFTLNKGFTLIELMLVIAIIGILTSIVMVSTGSSVEKSKKASAITTLSSVLPELVTCADDNGVAKSTTIVAGNPICCTTVACTAAFTGHENVNWKNIVDKTGYNYAGNPSGSLASGNYIFRATKSGQLGIMCDYAANACCDDNSTGNKTSC